MRGAGGWPARQERLAGRRDIRGGGRGRRNTAVFAGGGDPAHARDGDIRSVSTWAWRWTLRLWEIRYIDGGRLTTMAAAAPLLVGKPGSVLFPAFAAAARLATSVTGGL